MAFDRAAFLRVVEDSYSAYYNIREADGSTELPLVFCADYFQRDERFWLTKQITIYGNETNELVYVFSADVFGKELAEACMQYALDDGLPKVKPHREHQYTNIKVLFLTDAADDDALAAVRQKKFQVSYHHSLWGYSSLLTALVDVQTEKVWTNAAGRDMKKYFSKLFAAQKK